MSLINLCGWETGDFLECSANSGTASVQNTTARNAGGYALRCNPTGSNGGTATVRGIAASGASADANVTDSYLRFYFRFAALPANEASFLKIETNVSTKLTLYLTTLGKVRYEDTMLGGGTGTATMSANTWYRLNVVCGSHASTGTIQVSIDGSLDINTTGNTNATGAAKVTFGRSFGLSADIDFYFDDFVWDDASAPGAGQIVALLPSADGTFTSGTANGAASKWQCLDERPNDGDTTYVDGLSDTQSYVADLDLSGISVTSGARLKAVVLGKGNGMPGSIKARIYEPGAAGDRSTSGAATDPSGYGAVCLLTTGPAAGGSWDDSGLSGIEAGWVENDAFSGSRVTAVYGMLDYVPQPVPQRQRRRQRQTASRHPTFWTWW